MKKWLAMSALGVAVGVLTFYLRQERDDQPALAAETEQSSVNPAPIPAPLQPTNLTPAEPAEPASQEAPPSALPPKPFGNEFKGILEKNPIFNSAWEAEVRDPAWAQTVEDVLRNSYSGKADLMAYGMPTIECKKTLCQVRMSASGISSKELMGLEMEKSTQPPLALPVGTYTSSMSVVTDSQQEGVGVYMVFIRYMRTTEQP